MNKIARIIGAAHVDFWEMRILPCFAGTKLICGADSVQNGNLNIFLGLIWAERGLIIKI